MCIFLIVIVYVYLEQGLLSHVRLAVRLYVHKLVS